MSRYSYGDVTVRESLWDQIMDLDPIETYVTRNSETIKVTQKVHSWLEEPIASISSQAGTVELTATSYANNAPTLRTNTTQIIERGFRVAMTDENSLHAGWRSQFARMQTEKMKEWGNQLELSAVVGALVSGTGTAARTMAGIVRFAVSLVTTQSLVSLNSDRFNSFLGNAWDAGANHEVVLVGRTLKERISSFTSSFSTRNVAAEDALTVGRVDVFDSDHGRVTIVKHRYISNNNGLTPANTQWMATYIPDYVKIGFLDEPHFEDRPNDGYFKAGSIVGEATVMVANEKAVQFVQGLL